MDVREELRYSTDHEWVRLDGGRVYVGITDYAQESLGDIVYVQLPAVGTTIAAGESFGEVESTKSVSDVYAPIAGTVVQVNDALGDQPQLLNESPYEDGWICVIEPSDPADIDRLLDAAAYRSLVEA